MDPAKPFCRSCLTVDEIDPTKPFDAHIFKVCTGIEVKDTPFRSYLCSKCELNMKIAVEFRFQSHQADQQVGGLLESLRNEAQEIDAYDPCADDIQDILAEDFSSGDSFGIVESCSSVGQEVPQNVTSPVSSSRSMTSTPDWTISQCRKCFQVFPDPESLRRHRRKMHLKSPEVICATCHKTFASKSILKRHELFVHQQILPVQCESCPKTFASQSSMQRHLKIIHNGSREFICNHCGFAFDQKSNMKNHMQSHLPEPQFICEICGKSFYKANLLARHHQVHTEGRKFFCDTCGLSFKRRLYLAEHQKIHKNKIYTCDLCNKVYKSRVAFTEHKKMHEGKMITCTVDGCPKLFNSPYKLKEHLNKHEGKRPFACQFCDKKYTRSTHLSEHVRRKHKKHSNHTETNSIMDLSTDIPLFDVKILPFE